MNDSPQLRVLQQLGHTYRAMHGAFEASIGLSMPRWRILLMLHQQGVVSQKQLAGDLRIDPAALTRQVRALESQKLVQRDRDANDNRLINVVLTQAGHDLVQQMLPQRVEFYNRALSGLSLDDITDLEKKLNQLEQRLRQSME